MKELKREMAYVVNHKNGIFENNSVDNLEYTFVNTSTVSKGNCYSDEARSDKEISDYLSEACDKAWLLFV